MMTEPTYWKRCEECGGEARHLVSETPPEDGFITRVYQPCSCERGFAPLPSSALVIEDGIEAAAGRVQWEAWRMADAEDDCGASLAWARNLVRAAAAGKEGE